MNRGALTATTVTADDRLLAVDVQDAARGDRRAYARLVDRTRNVVCSISLAIMRDLPASEDVAQEVYLAAWRGLSGIRNPVSFLPWLRQLTRNRAHDQLRSRLRSRIDLNAEKMITAATDASPSALDKLVGAEEAALIAAALEALPDETRELVILYYREGKSAAQVGQLLGVREAAVKKRLSRAREILRTVAAERFGEAVARTAPGSEFAVSVVAALPASGPGLAAGLGFKAAGAKLGGLLGGAAVGMALGVLGVLVGAQLQSRQALDAAERRGIWRLSLVNLGSLLALAVVISWAGTHRLAWLAISGYVGLAGVLFFTTQLWLPRVIARRLATELARDPAAAARHQRRRMVRMLGWIVGTLCGGAGLLAGLLAK